MQELIQNGLKGWWNQDGGLGGRGIHASAQLGHLPGTGGEPWAPKGMGGTPSDWVWGVGGVKGEEKWRQDGACATEGWLGEGKGSHDGRG